MVLSSETVVQITVSETHATYYRTHIFHENNIIASLQFLMYCYAILLQKGYQLCYYKDIVSCWGFLICSEPQLYSYSTQDAVRIGNSFIYNPQSHVTTITHNYLLRDYAFTQL
jgi:hypothetical protein